MFLIKSLLYNSFIEQYVLGFCLIVNLNYCSNLDTHIFSKHLYLAMYKYILLRKIFLKLFVDSDNRGNKTHTFKNKITNFINLN